MGESSYFTYGGPPIWLLLGSKILGVLKIFKDIILIGIKILIKTLAITRKQVKKIKYF